MSNNVTVKAYAAQESGGKLQPFEYELGPIGPEHIDIQIAYCGICHSDLSMLNNDWRMTTYPFVPGHEVVEHAKIRMADPAISYLDVDVLRPNWSQFIFKWLKFATELLSRISFSTSLWKTAWS